MAVSTPILAKLQTGPALKLFRLQSGSARVFARAADIDPAIWQAAFGDSHKDFEYYRLIEETMTRHFDYRYLLLCDEAEDPIALQPLILVDQDLTASAQSLFAQIVNFLRKFWPRFLQTRMLMAGCLVGDGKLGVIAPAKARAASVVLAEALLAYARDQKISLLTVKDFPAAQRDELSPLTKQAYTRLPGFPPLALDLNFTSFEDYMEKKLSRVTRKGLRRKLRKVEPALSTITLEVLNDCRDVIDEIYPLYLEVAKRSPVEFEIFTPEYFIEAGRRMPERHRYFVWRQNGKAIAFSFCTIWNGEIYDNDIGLDYAVAHDLNLYYLTFRDLINWALQHNLKRYHSAPFNYDPKMHLRLELIDVDLYVRHTSGLINKILQKVAPAFAPARSDPVLRKHYEGTSTSWWGRFLGYVGNPWLQIAVNALIVTASELFLKLGARNTAHLTHSLSWTGFTGLASLWTWLGIVFVILSLLSWLYVLRHIPLSIAFPLSNVVHVLVPLSCWLFLGELISARRWFGITLVLIGLIIVAKPFARMEEKL